MMNFLTAAFNPMNFVNNLGYMGVGMIIIIAVIGIIIGATSLLNKFTGGKKSSADPKVEEAIQNVSDDEIAF